MNEPTLAIKGIANLYRKLPFEIEAIELAEDYVVKTLEGDMSGKKGDMLVTGVEGEQHIVRRDIFDKTYETIEACFVDLCWDFDGCIHAYTSGWIDVDVIPDPPVKNAIQSLYLYLNNYSIAIHSARSSSMRGITAMKEWLRTWDSDFRVNYHENRTLPPARGMLKSLEVGELVDRIEFPVHKPAAKVYIDDRGLRFDGRFSSPAKLNDAMKVWYDKD